MRKKRLKNWAVELNDDGMAFTQEHGRCPYCGSEDIDWGSAEPVDNMMSYPMTCNKCGKKSIEWYEMIYTSTIGDVATNVRRKK